MKYLMWRVAICCAVLHWGCNSAEVAQTDETDQSVDAGLQTDAFDPEMSDDVKVSILITPRQATYSIGSEIEIVGMLEIDGVTDTTNAWSTMPEGFGVRLSETTLQLTEAGSGLIELCVGEVCAQTPIFVVDQPTIRLSHPVRGQMIQVGDDQTVLVSGRLENFETGFPTVLVNGEVAETDEDFNFSIDVPTVPGLNALSIEVREPTLVDPPSLYMQYIAAHQFISFENGLLPIKDAITVLIYEQLLDNNLPAVTASPGATIQIFDIVQLLDLVIQTSEPLRWLPDPLPDFEGLDLSIDGIEFGEIDGEISIPSDIAEGSFSMTNAQIQTSGAVNFMGSSLSLDGTMTASLSAFLVLDGAIDETIILDLQEIEAELLSVDADYPSPTLNDLLEALDSELTDQVIGVLTNFIKRLFQEQALPLVQFAFEAMLEQIQILPIVVESPLEGIPNVELNALVQPKSLDLSQGQAALRVDVDISGVETPVTHQGDLGAFVTPTEEIGIQHSEPLKLIVKLDLLNALCHAIWKTGLLNSTPEIPTAITGLVSGVTANAKLPPVIEFNPQGGEEILLNIAELELAITPQGNLSPDLYILHLSVPARLAVNDGFITLQLDGDPSVRVDTILKVEESAINAQTVESLLLGAIWPLFRDTLSDGLTYGIGGIPIDPEILAEIAPGLTNLSLTPIISDNFAQAPGVITVGGQLIMEGTLTAPPPNNIE
jgi:hypothetical protein